MTYHEAISMFQSRYGRYIKKDNLPYVTDDEILMELSILQQELQNNFLLSDVVSTDNATPQTTVSAGDSVIEAGTGAGNIPSDIMQIWKVTINDTLNTELYPCAISDLRGIIKPSGVPQRYAYYLRGGNGILELDTLPMQDYTMTIYYAPFYPIYHGVGGVNTGAWSDVDYNATGYGGNLKLPEDWHSLVVEGALANVTGDRDLFELYALKLKTKLMYQPIHNKTSIPYDDGMNYNFQNLPEGQDVLRGYYRD